MSSAFLILRIFLFFLIDKSFSKIKKVLLLMICSEVSLIILKKILSFFLIPYTGIAFFFFFLNCGIFLLLPVYLLSKIKEFKKEKSHLEWIFFFSYLLTIAIFYPLISGQLLLIFFQVFYFVLYSYGILFFILNIKTKFSIQETILFFFVLVGLIEIILTVVFGISNWWLLQIGNLIVYFIVILFGIIFPIRNRFRN